MTEQVQGTLKVKTGFAEMMKGGVIMDVDHPGAGEDCRGCRRRVPSWRSSASPPTSALHGGVARMSDPTMIEGHRGGRVHPRHGEVPHRAFRGGAGAAEPWAWTYIDESEVLTPADDEYHVEQDGTSTCRSCAARATWARRCAASPRARP